LNAKSADNVLCWSRQSTFVTNGRLSRRAIREARASFRAVTIQQSEAWRELLSVAYYRTNFGSVKTPEWETIDVSVYWLFEVPTNANPGKSVGDSWPIYTSETLKHWANLGRGLKLYSNTNRIVHWWEWVSDSFETNIKGGHLFIKLGHGVYGRP
jgi:hypothetical protein